MATKKISELEAITEADGSDALVIVDVSEGRTNKITKNNLLQGAGHTIEMSLNENYQIVLKLKNTAGTELSTASIDLPNENSITDISYNNGKLTLTKQSGTTTEVDITGLINGLVTESDFETFTTQLNQVLQELDETKADAEDVEALQTRVTELEQENEDLKNNQLTNTPEIATSHYLQDSADSRFRKFIPIGRTTQESTTGKNLFDSKIISGTKSGLTFSFLQDTGTNKISGDKYGSGIIKFIDEPIIISETGDYSILTQYFSGNVTYPNEQESSIPRLYLFNDADGTTYTGNIIGYCKKQNTEKTIQLNAGTYYIGFLIWGDHTIFNNYEIGIDIVSGSNVPSKFEKYTGGEPAPNPNYPFPIKNTGDNVNLIYDANHNKGTSITQDGITYTVNNDGSISVNGTATVNSSYYMMGSGNLYSLTLKPGTYVLSGGISSDAWIRLFDGTNYYDTDATTIKKFTITDEINAFVALRIRTGTTINATFYPKLEPGTKATPYSPYGCGNVNEKIENKNFISLKNINTSWAEVVYKGQEDETLLCNGTKSGGGYAKFTATKRYFKAGTYTCNSNLISGSITKNGSNYNTTIYISKLSPDSIVGSSIGNVGRNSKVSFTIPEDGEYYIRFAIWDDGVIFNNAIVTVQIEQGTTATSYVPHSEQKPSFPLAQGQKFYEGSHPDDDEKVHHVSGEIILDGTVGGYNADYNWFYLSFTNLQIQKPKTLNILSNYFKYYNRNEFASDKTLNGISFNTADISTASTFVIRNTNCTNADEYKTWLAEVLPIVQYELEEEQTEDFTEEQKTAWEQIKKARTYKNITHISSEDETPANVELEYVVDINTIDDRITALEAKVDLLEE